MNRFILIFSFFFIQFLNSQVKIDQLFKTKINTELVEHSFTISPDNNHIMFTRTETFYKSAKRFIYYSDKVNGFWTEPELATFSGEYSDSSPFYSPCGKHILFTSKRPNPNPDVDNNSSNIWLINRSNMDSLIFLSELNSNQSDYSPTMDLDENIYFGSMRNSGFGMGDLWKSRKIENRYLPAENLGKSINTSNGEWGSSISPNGKLLIFEASDRPGNITAMGDLYYSVFKKNKWSKAERFNSKINSPASDLTPHIHQDQLFFASNRIGDKMINNDVDIYVIDISKMAIKFD